MSGRFAILNAKRAQVAAARVQAILDRLAKGDATVMQLATAAGISRCTADRYLNDALYGKVHIACWNTTGALSAVWTLGPGKNAPKPKDLQNRPPKVEPDPEDWFDERAERLRAEIQPFREPLVAAFYGAAT